MNLTRPGPTRGPPDYYYYYYYYYYSRGCANTGGPLKIGLLGVCDCVLFLGTAMNTASRNVVHRRCAIHVLNPKIGRLGDQLATIIDQNPDWDGANFGSKTIKF